MKEYPNGIMGTEIPTWLDETFLTKCLQGGEMTKEDVTVVKCDIQPAVAAGNNYMSHLFRVKVDYKSGSEEHSSKSKDLIVKAPIREGFIKEMADEMKVYDREVQMYSDILPKMYELYKYEFAPKSYFCPAVNALVLEDMRPLGYVMLDRLKQLDFDHCKQFFITLAKFHATSVAVSHKYPSYIEHYGEELFYSNVTSWKEHNQSFLNGALSGIIKMLRELEGCEHYADILHNKINTFWDTLVDIFKPRSGLNVLNHGDTWTNNILFKHDDLGNVVDAKLIDFQITRYGSPTTDLIYFIWNSANEEVRESRLEELFEIYRITLNETLEELNCSERLCEEEMQNELKISSPYAAIVISAILPIILSDPDNLINMDTVTAENINSKCDDSPFSKAYNGKHYRKIIPTLLKQVEQFGGFS